MNLGTANGRSVEWIPATGTEASVQGIVSKYRVTHIATGVERIVTERLDRRQGRGGYVYECSCGTWGNCDDVAAVLAARPLPDPDPSSRQVAA